MVDPLATHLLWRHIAGGSEHQSGVCGALLGQRLRSLHIFSFGQLGDAEIENLDVSIVGHEKVLGLEIAMDDATLVGSGQAACDLDGVVDGLASGQRPALQSFPQRRALEQLADDVGRSIVLADVVHHQDVGMVEAAGGAGLL